jgi:catechol 2,3-dioxygenase-like lactoylglutathione lyase family enzyme
MQIERTNTILYCHRWQETVAFYRDVLGFPVHYQNDWFVEFQLADRAYLSIADERRASVHGVEGQGITLSWQAASLSEIRTTLASQGVVVGEVLSKWGASLFYLHDPEGHRIELWQPNASA